MQKKITSLTFLHMKREFTASAYIFSQGQILLHHHKKLQKLLPPGGHVEENELPHVAAIRETFEETGYTIKILLDEHLKLDFWNAHSIPRPYLCLVEKIPQYKEVPAHEHIDMVYIGYPILHPKKLPQEVKWYTKEEIAILPNDKTIFAETKQTILHLFSTLPKSYTSRSSKAELLI